ncbi:Protein kinase-like domain protein [Niveomyces insectorum RCEF 264]|uniref:EKC/KEOPS complex subunit BUD32 n=1 Tax=Niveomyces insectorum RCEF 264 TaxID=1081102 RepID=A0A167Z0A9_9HYPO|nr:Protein kinase-like domain protein [Niveomyces insectorum RCEF 264]
MWWSIIGITFNVIVTCSDGKTALKGYQVWEDGRLRANCEFPCEELLAREAYLYRHIGAHPQILQFHGLEEVHPGVHSLRLEFAQRRDVRQYIATMHEGPPPPYHVRVRMALDAARAVAHIHARGVFHADLSCRNLFLFDDWRVKLGDFGGSMIAHDPEGAQHDPEFTKSTTREEAEYALPLRGRAYVDLPRIQREIFALGSAVFEMVAWRRVYAAARDEDERDDMYDRGELPPLTGGVVGDRLGDVGPVIQRCWDEQYERADDVAADLEKALAAADEKKAKVR